MLHLSWPGLTRPAIENERNYHEVRRRKRRAKPVDEIVEKLDDDYDDDASDWEEPPSLPVKRPVYPGEKPRGTSAINAAKSEPTSPEKTAVPFGPPPPPEVWSAVEIADGRAQCDKQLRVTDVVFEQIDPIKEGACGMAAPVRLKAFNSERGPALELKPAATISCKMTAALRRWVDEVVQPKAKAKLDATIIRMSNASAYVCRTRYDDPTQRMSQHAYGNAFDVSEFITAKGEVINVLDHWNAGDERAAFLREVHAGACEIFGTTLGPEANEAHKNHFHFDMADRRRGICDFVPGQQARKREAEAQARLGEKPPGTPQVAPKPDDKPRRRRRAY